jgi:hypothetical protein
MSLHSWQIASGITPTLIKPAKIAQPRHTAKTASSVAATAMTPSTAYAATGRWNPNANTAAVTDRTAPIPCAKRFGGPGTGLAATPSSGVTTRVTSWPSGLNVGPVRTRATKPVGDDGDEPRLVKRNCDDAHEDYPAGHQPGGDLVDRVRETQ